MEPWVAIVLTGAAIAGYGWLLPAGNGKTPAAGPSLNEETYDRLLEDLETENRELVDAVVKFKQEQDETVERLGRRIRELEQQMAEWKAGERAPAASASGSGPAAVGAAAPGVAPAAAEAAAAPPAADAKAAMANAKAAAADAEAAMANVKAAAADSEAAMANAEAAAAAEAAPAAVASPPPDEQPRAGGPKEQPAAETSIRRRYAELVSLYERGRSIEQIAKALAMNKGEVQLILQLAKREVGQRA